jgi:anti-sigma B factor antagonist
VGDKAAASSLKVEVDRSGSVPVVRCSGRLILGLTDQLLIPVKELIPQYKCIVLDCTDLVRMDSSGLGTVVRLYVSAKSAGCALRMKNVGPPIRKLLGVTNLLDALTIVGENNIKLC